MKDCESTKCVAIWYHEIQKIQEIIQQDEGKNIQKRSGSPVRPDTGGQPSGDQPLSIHMLDSYAYTGAATVKASSLNVRSDAGTGYSAVARLAAGASIQITGEKKGTDGKTWYRSSTQAVTVRQVQVMYPPLT